MTFGILRIILLQLANKHVGKVDLVPFVHQRHFSTLRRFGVDCDLLDNRFAVERGIYFAVLQ
jgi:hypothetical protein